MGTAPPLVVICVLNYNRPTDTIACIASLLAGDAPVQHLLVIDNGSTDDSVATLRARFGPAIELLTLETNRYFAGGMNAGIERALALDAEMVFLLNNDTLVAPDAVSRLLATAAEHPEAGILAPAIHLTAEPERAWSLGSRRTRWAPFPLEVARHGLRGDGRAAPIRVDLVTGCAMLIRRQVIERIGALDTHYRMYFEDADYCMRAAGAGLGLLVEPRARIYHAVAQTSRRGSDTVQYLKIWGRVRFYRSYHFGPSPWLTHAALCAQEASRALGLRLRGQTSRASAAWRAVIDGYREPIERDVGGEAPSPLLLPR